MKKIKIYLAGNIKKDHEIVSKIYWTEKDLEVLKSTKTCSRK